MELHLKIDEFLNTRARRKEEIIPCFCSEFLVISKQKCKKQMIHQEFFMRHVRAMEYHAIVHAAKTTTYHFIIRLGSIVEASSEWTVGCNRMQNEWLIEWIHGFGSESIRRLTDGLDHVDQ